MNDSVIGVGKRMVVGGSFGLTCLAADGSFLWHVPEAKLPGTLGQDMQVDIDNNGRVAVMRRSSGNDFEYRLYNTDGTPRSQEEVLVKDYVWDIAMSNDTIALCGFNNGTLNGQPSCGGESSGLPVQTAFIFYYQLTGTPGPSGDMVFYGQTYNYAGSEAGGDIADTRMYHLNFGLDNKLYFMGETAGTKTIYRFDGGLRGTEETNSIAEGSCTFGGGGVIDKTGITEVYQRSNLSNTASAHVGFYGYVDHRTLQTNPGNITISNNPYVLVQEGEFIIPRLSGKSNSFFARSDRSYIHANREGAVYITGFSSAFFDGRSTQKVNGKSIGKYNGDMTLLITGEDFGGVRFWGTLAAPDPTTATATEEGLSGTGAGTARFAISDSLVAYFTRVDNYTMAIKDPNQLDTRPAGNTQDGYLALFFPDVWNFANRDTIVETVVPGDTIASPDLIAARADFTANQENVCVGDNGTFQVSLTSTSVILNPTDYPDYTWTLTWIFSDTAEVVSGDSTFTGAAGAGLSAYTNPVVKWTSPGLKTVKLVITGISSQPTQDTVLLRRREI